MAAELVIWTAKKAWPPARARLCALLQPPNDPQGGGGAFLQPPNGPRVGGGAAEPVMVRQDPESDQDGDGAPPSNLRHQMVAGGRGRTVSWAPNTYTAPDVKIPVKLERVTPIKTERAQMRSSRSRSLSDRESPSSVSRRPVASAWRDTSAQASAPAVPVSITDTPVNVSTMSPGNTSTPLSSVSSGARSRTSMLGVQSETYRIPPRRLHEQTPGPGVVRGPADASQAPDSLYSTAMEATSDSEGPSGGDKP